MVSVLTKAAVLVVVVVGLTTRPKLSLTPLYAAFKVTAVWTDTAWNVTPNVVDVAPAATIAVAGTLAAAEDELSTMVAPDVRAAPVSATVQFELPGGVTVAGVQEKALNPGCCWIVTVLPLPDADKVAADASAATTF
jgi:hypothetical protein